MSKDKFSHLSNEDLVELLLEQTKFRERDDMRQHNQWTYLDIYATKREILERMSWWEAPLE